MDKFGAISKVIVILLIALILCSCAMLLIDSAFNGTVGDWFVAHFMDQVPVVDRTQVLAVLMLPVDAAVRTLTYGSTKEILRRVDATLGSSGRRT